MTSTSAAASKPIKSLVAIGQRTVQQTDPLPLRVMHLIEPESARRVLERANGDVGTDDQLVASRTRRSSSAPGAAAEIEHALGAATP